MAVAGIISVAGIAYAASPNDVHFSVRNTANNGDVTVNIGPLAGGAHSVFGVDGSTELPVAMALGDGLSSDGAQILVNNVSQSHITGLSDALDTIRLQIGANNDLIVSADSDILSLANIIAALPHPSWTEASTTAMDYIANKPDLGISYEGATKRINSFPEFKSSTVASGVAVFQLTVEGTATGTPIFPDGIEADSVNAFVSDATASYQMSYAFSNSNKTLTVTANKLTTANILSGLLGQTAANGSVVKLQVWGY